jgi:hypothetical protein
VAAWAPAAPEELAASLLVTAAGDAGEPPAVTVFGAMLGSAEETATQLGALADLAGAEPGSAELAPGGYREATHFLSGLGAEEEAPGHPFSRSEFFRRPLPAEAIGALVERLLQRRRPGEVRESTSARGAARRTAWRPRPRPSCTAASASCSSTR